MCGIVGLWYKDSARHVAEADLRAMCARILHRGPDDEGVLVDGHFGMGMRRLSIIDLAGGHQPIFNEDGTVATKGLAPQGFSLQRRGVKSRHGGCS